MSMVIKKPGRKKPGKKSIKASIDIPFGKKEIDKLGNACSCGCSSIKDKCTGGCFYFLGVIGAVVYNISTATGFWTGVLGVLKALVWPAFLVYGLLKMLGL